MSGGFIFRSAKTILVLPIISLIIKTSIFLLLYFFLLLLYNFVFMLSSIFFPLFFSKLVEVSGEVPHVMELISTIDKLQSVFHCIAMQVELLKELKRKCHFVEAYRPSLPFLIGGQLATHHMALHQIVSPCFTYQNRVASQCLHELFILKKGRNIWCVYLVCISVATWLVNGEGPPVVVAAMELTIFFKAIPTFKMQVLLKALSNNFLALLTHSIQVIRAQGHIFTLTITPFFRIPCVTCLYIHLSKSSIAF